MGNTFLFFRRLFMLLPALSLSLICSAPPAIADSTDEPRLADIDSITILPVAFPANQTVEDRAERLESLYGKLDVYIYKALLRKLAMKGYVLDKPRGWTLPNDWTVETLKSRTPQELAALIPTTASYAAFLFVERIESSNHVVQSSANAEVSIRIVHRASATIIWQRSGEGEFSENILFTGMLLTPLTPDKHAAIEKAFEKLFDDFPEKPFS